MYEILVKSISQSGKKILAPYPYYRYANLLKELEMDSLL